MVEGERERRTAEGDDDGVMISSEADGDALRAGAVLGTSCNTASFTEGRGRNGLPIGSTLVATPREATPAGR